MFVLKQNIVSFFYLPTEDFAIHIPLLWEEIKNSVRPLFCPYDSVVKKINRPFR